MTSRIEVTQYFMENVPNWGIVYNDFYNYILCKIQPPHFGRPGYIRPRPLFHIQIATTPQTIKRWANIADPHKRVVLRSECANDFWLLYAYDNAEDRFLLLSVFGPNAHNADHRDSYLRTLKTDIVDPWLTGKLHCYEPPDEG